MVLFEVCGVNVPISPPSRSQERSWRWRSSTWSSRACTSLKTLHSHSSHTHSSHTHSITHSHSHSHSLLTYSLSLTPHIRSHSLLTFSRSVTHSHSLSNPLSLSLTASDLRCNFVKCNKARVDTMGCLSRPQTHRDINTRTQPSGHAGWGCVCLLG